MTPVTPPANPPDARMPMQPAAPPVQQPPSSPAASYQLPPMPPAPPAPPIGFVKPVIFPPMKDRLHRTIIRFRASLGTFVLVSVATVLPSAAAEATRGQLPIGAAIGLGLLSFLLSLIAPYAMIAVAAGELNFGRAMARGFRAVLPGFLTVFIASFILLPPSLLLIPGMILSVRFMLMMNVVVNERRKGVEALARSRDLVFGRTATLFFDQLGLSIGFGILSLMVCGVVAAATWAARPAFVAQSASIAAVACMAVFYPVYLIYLQTFYEDCVAVVGKEWTAKPSRKLFYRILAALGLLTVIGMVALPIFLMTKAKLSLPDISKLNINASITDMQPKDESAGLMAPPPQHASTPEERDLKRYGDVNMLKLALGGWFSDNKSYPDKLDQLAPKYLTAVPKDPDGTAYGYQKQELTYIVSFTLEQGVLAFAKGPHTLTANGFDVVPQPTPIPPDEKTVTTSVPAPPSAPAPTPAPAPEPPSPLPPQPQSDNTAPADTDGDGLSDEQEMVYNTNPNVPDTDGDGLSDGEEVYVYGTNPLVADTDGDGYADGAEIAQGYNPKGPGSLTAEQKAQYDANMQTFHANR